MATATEVSPDRVAAMLEAAHAAGWMMPHPKAAEHIRRILRGEEAPAVVYARVLRQLGMP